VTEETIEGELTVDDIINEASDAGYHSILELWRAILAPAETEKSKRVTPQWANRIVSQYNGIGFASIPDFKDLYYDKVIELAQILEARIEEDPECLHVASAEEDIETNWSRYKQMLIDWQKAFLLWELGWRADDPDAAIEIAAIAEVHKMFFDEKGILGLLDQIPFEFTEMDQADLAAELQALKDGDE
jgi:hypothetical protein